MKTKQTECSETSAYKIQTPGNYPEENIQQVFFLLKLLQLQPDLSTLTFGTGILHLIQINHQPNAKIF